MVRHMGVVCGPHTKYGKDIRDERKRTLECAPDEEVWKAGGGGY